MGDGEQRALDCASAGECANASPALKQKLLAPKALASAPDGSIYIADYDLVRRITADGEISSILRLK